MKPVTYINELKFNPILLFLLITASLFSCNKDTEKNETNKFSGLWSLYIMEQKDLDTGKWSEWKNGMQGYILYDDKDNMAVHLTTKGYEDTDLRFPNFTDTISNEALKYLTNSYVYFAKYSVDKDKGVVEHARISHSNPGEWNAVVQRKFTFKGDTLILETLEGENSGLRLTWIKSVSNLR